jgi:lipid-binding SYLF domain-containing protein
VISREHSRVGELLLFANGNKRAGAILVGSRGNLSDAQPHGREGGKVMATRMYKVVRLLVVGTLWMLLINTTTLGRAFAASASEINSNVRTTLRTLYQTQPGAQALADKSKGILVFPHIVKAGFMVGGQYGDGALLKRGRTSGYFRSVAGSFGFQAGAQSFGYVLFFMDTASLNYLDRSNGWELGTGPSLVVLDKGFARSLSTTTMQHGVYAFIFNQKGLMGGIGIQGSKITRIHPDS